MYGMTVFSTNEPKPDSRRHLGEETQGATAPKGTGPLILTDPEVCGDLLHLLHEVSAQVFHIFHIILHGEGQVHQGVHVDGVVFSTFELQLEGLRFTFTREKSGYLEPELLQEPRDQKQRPFTRSEREGELLGLDLSDLLGLQLPRLVLAVGDRLVLIDHDASPWVLDVHALAVPVLQGLQVIAASRLGLALTEEGLKRRSFSSHTRLRSSKTERLHFLSE